MRSRPAGAVHARPDVAMLDDVDAHAKCLGRNKSSLALLLRVPLAADVGSDVGVCQHLRPFNNLNSGGVLRRAVARFPSRTRVPGSSSSRAAPNLDSSGGERTLWGTQRCAWHMAKR